MFLRKKSREITFPRLAIDVVCTELISQKSQYKLLYELSLLHVDHKTIDHGSSRGLSNLRCSGVAKEAGAEPHSPLFTTKTGKDDGPQNLEGEGKTFIDRRNRIACKLWGQKKVILQENCPDQIQIKQSDYYCTELVS